LFAARMLHERQEQHVPQEHIRGRCKA
jgi:hypothetical protein